jgi:demethylmenaquinone methyltransferase/2-methoxy-6-polyprenyl-1,4-benzoquinol methylase
MRRLRQIYYNCFSRVYDRFIALHYSDTQQNIRRYLASKAQTPKSGKVLDLCTGTGSLLSHLRGVIGDDGIVIGLDFSWGMLQVAKKKVRELKNVFLVEGDAARLPFKTSTFDAVSCSHAFYELKGESQDMCLREIRRVLKQGRPFLMMEHDIPKNPLVRILFYLRLFSMGVRRAIQILRHKQPFLSRHFSSVEKTLAPSGRSKIMICKG